MEDERTIKLLELFGMLEEKPNINNILNMEMNEYDNFRVFRLCDINRYEEQSLERNDEEQENHFQVINAELEDCKLWRIGKKIKHLLSLTKPSSIKEINLPFDEIFIDEDFRFDDIRTFGIKISKSEINSLSAIRDFISWSIKRGEMKNITEEQLKNTLGDDNTINIRYGLFVDGVFVSRLILYDYKKLKDIGLSTKMNRYKKIDKFIANFVSNLLLFLNEPRIKIYVQENNNNEKRKKKGKITIPSLLRTKIELGLEEYIDRIYYNGESNSKLGFSFWVMGHWRTLLSPRFVNKQGQKIWIAPHIVGSGLMPPQVFDIT